MTIPYGRQDISEADCEAVLQVLRSEYLTQGPVVPEFEQAIAAYCGVDHAIATNSATSALHIACACLRLGPGDWLWTSPNTFVASANCALFCGAKVDFVDIDSQTYNLCADALEKKLIHSEKKGTLPKIVMPVHFAGQSPDMARIRELGIQYGFKIIEDASHAIGASHKGQKVGSCEYSDVTVFSFHPVKIITSGEGGIAVTQNPELARRMKLLRSHGVSNDSQDFDVRPSDELWNYQQILLGFNYRMTEIQAALGLSQLNRLDEFVEKRHRIAHRYDRDLNPLPIVIPCQDTNNYSSYHLYPIRIKPNAKKIGQRDIYDALHNRDIRANLHYIPVYRQPFYERLGFKEGYCINAEEYFRSSISIPMFSALSNREQTQIIETLTNVFDGN